MPFQIFFAAFRVIFNYVLEFSHIFSKIKSMYLKYLITCLSVVLCFSIPVLTIGQSSKSIFFQDGKNSTTVTGTVKGRQYVDYKLNILAGQTLSVSINSKSTSVNFNVLPPGSKDVAIYNSSINGNNYSEVAEKSGLYAIRIYLMGAAESENRSVNFGLTVGLVKPAVSKDAKVSGTNYNATGKLRSSKGKAAPGSVMSDYGVKRTGSGGADVYVTYPGSIQRILRFSQGEWTCLSSDCKLTYTRTSDEWEVIVNGTYHFSIPDAVINGG
jgi:hypothetical protein